MYISVIATIAMIILGGLSKLLTRDWFHPATLFCVVWAGVCGVAMAVAPENIVSATGPLWILLNCTVVVAGGIAGTAFAGTSYGRRQAHTARYDPQTQILSNRALRTLTSTSIVLGLLYIVLWLHSQGISIGQLANLRGLGKAAMKMSVGRYSKTGHAASSGVQLLLSVSYLAPLLGAALFVRRERRSDTALAALSMLPSLLAFATQSTRSSIIYGVSMWLAGYMSTRLFCGLRVQQISRRTLLLASMSVPLGLLLIASGDVLRGGGVGAETLGKKLLTDRTKTYMCGHLAALSQWMDVTDLDEIQPAFGQYTFAGAYELARPGTRVGGITSDFTIIATGGTNVYTYFRGLIEDLSLPGSLLVILLVAAAGGYAYRRVLERDTHWMGALASCYGAILLFLTSIFNYNSMILAFALYGVIWAGFTKVQKAR